MASTTLARVPRTKSAASANGKPDTRKLILDTAEDLLQQRGFSAFSYHDIADQLGVKNAAIHYHFPSKNDLGVALVQRYRDRFRRWFAEQNAPSASAWDKLEWYLGMTCKYVEQDFKICPGGVLETGFKVLPEEMQVETQALVREALAWFAEVLKEGRERGEMTFSGNPEDKAVLLLGALQGALQIARALGRGAFDQAMTQIRRELGKTT